MVGLVPRNFATFDITIKYAARQSHFLPFTLFPPELFFGFLSLSLFFSRFHYFSLAFTLFVSFRFLTTHVFPSTPVHDCHSITSSPAMV